MINYRVRYLEKLLELLGKKLFLFGEMEVYEKINSAWIPDPEGNKIELREPVHKVFEKLSR